MTAEAIAKALGGRKAGSGWTARCPAHDDRTPSLSIRDADDNKVLVHCHAGCDQERVIAMLQALGLCLAAIQATAHPAWAALSTSGLRSLELPQDVHALPIIGLAGIAVVAQGGRIHCLRTGLFLCGARHRGMRIVIVTADARLFAHLAHLAHANYDLRRTRRIARKCGRLRKIERYTISWGLFTCPRFPPPNFLRVCAGFRRLPEFLRADRLVEFPASLFARFAHSGCPWAVVDAINAIGMAIGIGQSNHRRIAMSRKLKPQRHAPSRAQTARARGPRDHADQQSCAHAHDLGDHQCIA
jgi:hypothetical protein